MQYSLYKGNEPRNQPILLLTTRDMSLGHQNVVFHAGGDRIDIATLIDSFPARETACDATAIQAGLSITGNNAPELRLFYIQGPV